MSFPALDITEMRRATEALSGHAAEAHRKQLAAAEANVRRAEELESAAQDQEEAARTRREQATEALKAARTALSNLQQGR